MFASVHIVRYPSLWRALWGFQETRPRIAREPGVRFRHAIIAGQSAVPANYAPDQSEFPRLRNIFPFHVTWAYHLEPSIALLILWEHEEALDRFLAGSPVLKGWRAAASEIWHVSLRAIFAKGT